MLRLAGLVASLALAAAPSATTGPVTSVGATTATVSGSVNPNGASTSWTIEYGTSTSYGSHTSSMNAGSGTSAVAISSSLTGLRPGTTYHYRVVATNGSGTAHGADGILTTSPAPQVSTGSASGVTSTAATLSGTVNPSGRATTWYFEYGTSTSYGTRTQAKDAGSGTSTLAVTAAVTGLKSGATYHFRLVASSDAGTSRGSDRTFFPSAPPGVTTKGASSIRDTTATLTAAVNPNGQFTTAYFEYGTTSGYGSKSSARNLGSGRGSTGFGIGIGGLAPGTTYHYRVVATNGTGTNAGADATFTTTGPPGVTIGAPGAVTSTTATLTGSVDSRGHSTSWYFEYGPTAAYGVRTATQSQSASVGAHPVSVAIGGLTAGTAYHFRLVASNGAGTTLGPDTVFTTAGPAVTVTASVRVVTLRRVVVLRGHVASGRPNESVAVFALRFDSGSFAQIATVLTDAAGNWSLPVHPPIATTYKGIWNGSSSATVAVAVRPGVSIRALSLHRITTHVTGARSFRGRIVQLQRRRADGTWRTIGRSRLGSGSSAVFVPSLRRGRSTLRVAFSVNQAGGGYLGGFSRSITVRR